MATTTMLSVVAEDKQICDGTYPMIFGGTDGGIVLPLGGEWEGTWPRSLQVILYLIGLLWCFMGVGMIADIFMGAIEKITSARKRIYCKKAGKTITVKVWNNTIANLSLMALGSSAPEILLSVIELTITNNMRSGELGPSTIVGSAAFNLLVISAVCVAAIPDGEVRYIKDMGVFTVTACFSIFAYVWLLVILVWVSKDVVEVWEGALTFLFFPLLLVIAYLADIGALPGTAKPEPASSVHPESSKTEIAAAEYKIRQKYGTHANLDENQVAALMAYEYAEAPSRAVCRISATRMLCRSRTVDVNASPWCTGKRLSMELLANLMSLKSQKRDEEKPVVGFTCLCYTVLESHGTVQVAVERNGVRLNEKLRVHYTTEDGTAVAKSKDGKAEGDYHAIEGDLEFGPGETMKEIPVKIVHSEGFEDTEEFYIQLSRPRIVCDNGTEEDAFLHEGLSRLTVCIIDEDLPGVFKFEQEELTYPDSPAGEGAVAPKDVKTELTNSTDHYAKENHANQVKVTVKRVNGCSGSVSCQYATEDGSAIQDADYVQTNGVLEFKPGQLDASFYIEIMASDRYEDKNEDFRIILTDPTNGAKFDQTTDGGLEKCICTVVITADKQHKDRIDKVWGAMNMNMDKVRLGSSNWKAQFTEAVYWQKDATPMDGVFHCIGLPWRLLFAIVPPADFAGGWACFFSALCMIGAVTAVIGDMATLLGCAMGLCPSITAITFVAMGTSLPDTFASKTAAVNEEYADNSIGNITGSNSVNVFLGLGLPWFIGAVYWKANDDVFAVSSDGLGDSVTVFTICAVVCLLSLMVRRKVVGGELGGSKKFAYATAAFFVGLWLIYIISSILLGGC